MRRVGRICGSSTRPRARRAEAVCLAYRTVALTASPSRRKIQKVGFFFSLPAMMYLHVCSQHTGPSRPKRSRTTPRAPTSRTRSPSAMVWHLARSQSPCTAWLQYSPQALDDSVGTSLDTEGVWKILARQIASIYFLSSRAKIDCNLSQLLFESVCVLIQSAGRNSALSYLISISGRCSLLFSNFP